MQGLLLFCVLCRGRDLGLGLGLGPLGEKMMPAVVLNVAAALGAALHQARQGKARPCESSPAGGPFHFISLQILR